jgi:hypothetical protein
LDDDEAASALAAVGEIGSSADSSGPNMFSSGAFAM